MVVRGRRQQVIRDGVPLAKVLWATGADPVTRCGKLADFCRSHGLDAEADFYQRSLQALQGSTKALSDPPQRGDAKL